MKYVIYKVKSLYLPVAFPDHITHSQVKIEWPGCTLHSAGFFLINSFGFPVIEPGISESLKIGPSAIDQEILQKFLMNFGTSFFIDYDHLDN